MLISLSLKHQKSQITSSIAVPILPECSQNLKQLIYLIPQILKMGTECSQMTVETFILTNGDVDAASFLSSIMMTHEDTDQNIPGYNNSFSPTQGCSYLIKINRSTIDFTLSIRSLKTRREGQGLRPADTLS